MSARWQTPRTTMMATRPCTSVDLHKMMFMQASVMNAGGEELLDTGVENDRESIIRAFRHMPGSAAGVTRLQSLQDVLAVIQDRHHLGVSGMSATVL